MFVEKLDAIILHKFIKENIDETVKTVDIRPINAHFENVKAGIVYSKTKQGLEPNFILYNDTNFCISISNHSTSKLIKNKTSEDINKLWQGFLSKTFGEAYNQMLENETTK